MKNSMRFFVFLIIMVMSFNAYADFTPTKQPRSYILMDYDTGTIMAEYQADETYPIASVTKVMTMLICMEAIQSGKISTQDIVTASEYACSMGGSQIYLEPGEQMTVDELLKSIAVGSANDASVAMAEHIMGSESSFVQVMNERAKALNMTNTNFVNCNGLDEDNHYSSARDVAIMSRELLKHKAIYPYLSIWMDSVRGGQFGLSNTNKLIRFYDGAIGIKTGSTSDAKYCLSSAASRNGLTLIGVVLGAESSSDRFETAKELLNYGFSNYKIDTIINKDKNIGQLKVNKGTKEFVDYITADDFKILTGKNYNNNVQTKVVVEDYVNAPVKKGDVVGKIEITKDGKLIGEVELKSNDEVPKLGTADVLIMLLKSWMMKY